MGSDMIKMGDAFKTGVPVVFNEPDDDHLQDGIGGGYGIIKYRGKNWSVRWQGQDKYFLRPDDQTGMPYIDVIILRKSAELSKSYYPGGYEEGSSDRPTCASITGVVPDGDVKVKQSEACGICPHNEWRNLPNGKRGKACTDYARCAVLLMPSSAVLAVGQPIMEPLFLRIPPASLKNIAAYGDHLSGMGHRYYGVVTRLSFKQESATPEILFSGVQPLSMNERDLIVKLRNDPLSLRITGEDMQARLQHALPQRTGVTNENPKAAGGNTSGAEQVQSGQLLDASGRQATMEIIPPSRTPAPGSTPPAQSTSLGLVEAAALSPAPGTIQGGPGTGAPASGVRTGGVPSVGQSRSDIGDGGPQNAALDNRLAALLGEAGVVPAQSAQ